MNPTKTDPVNRPAHYTRGPIEVIEVIESFGLGYHLGNVTKYVLRAGYKDDEIQDLEKARWYLDRKIAQLKTTKEEEAARAAQAIQDRAGEPGTLTYGAAAQLGLVA